MSTTETKRQTHRTPKKGKRRKDDTSWHASFIKALTSIANVKYACDLCAISRATAYEHKAKFPAFSKAWDEACEEAMDYLEQVAFKRATAGQVESQEFDKETGKILLRQTVRHSDTLLIFLLKANRPGKYREHHVITGEDGGPIQISAQMSDALEKAYGALPMPEPIAKTPVQLPAKAKR